MSSPKRLERTEEEFKIKNKTKQKKLKRPKTMPASGSDPVVRKLITGTMMTFE